MRRAAAGLLLAALLSAGCGEERAAGPVTTGPVPPPFDETPPPAGTDTGTAPGGDTAPGIAAALALELFVRAAGSGEADVMWELLSEASRERFGPTRAEFRRGAAAAFFEGAGSFARTDYRVLVAAGTDPGWAVAAIAGEREAEGTREYAAYAAAVRREDGAWRLELGGPVLVEPLTTALAPADDAIAARVTAPAALDAAALWLDGRALRAETRPAGERRRVVAARLPDAVGEGLHVAVAFARAGGEATALAWVVRRAP